MDWHARFVPCRAYLRLETLAEGLLARCRRFSDFVEAFRAALIRRRPRWRP